MRFFSLCFLLFFLSFDATAQVGKCKELLFKENRIYEIKASLYRSTRIELPEPMLGKPVLANELWTVDGHGRHIFLQPTSSEAEGSNANLFVIGERYNYNFKLRRVRKSGDLCIIFKQRKSSPFEASFQNMARPITQENRFLNQTVQNLRAEVNDLKSQQYKDIGDALKKYRTFMYTHYSWRSQKISSVFDDGRFTFIRVVPNNHGEMALTAELDKKWEMIEYQVDSDNLYKIVGIFPKIKLKYGKSTITIKRKDTLSHGVY